MTDACYGEEATALGGHRWQWTRGRRVAYRWHCIACGEWHCRTCENDAPLPNEYQIRDHMSGKRLRIKTTA